MVNNSDNMNNSVKHTIEYTTNIPGSKVSILDPNNITYSDLFVKPIQMNSIIYIHSAKHIDDFSAMNKEEIKNILFNKQKYDKFTENKLGKPINDNNKDDLIFSYLTNIFTTYPKSNNIKQTTELTRNIKHGLKFDMPFKNNVYTYLNINGTYYTISRVIFRNDSSEKSENKKLLELYEDYKVWKHAKKGTRQAAIKASVNELEKRLKIIQQLLKEQIPIKKKTAIQSNDKTEDKDLIDYLTMVSDEKMTYATKESRTSNTSKRIDNMLEAFNVINDYVINDLGKDKLTPDIEVLEKVLKLVEASHDVDDGWAKLNIDATLFRKFRLNRSIFTDFKKLLDQHVMKLTLSRDVDEGQYTDMYKDSKNYKGESIYKPFTDLNAHLSTHYEIYGTHNYENTHKYQDTSGGIIDDIKNKVYVPIVNKKEANNNEKINIHLDLIKGKITDDNKGNMGCEYSDANLAERFDKLIGAVEPETTDWNYLPLYDAVTKTEKPTQKSKGGKRKTTKNNTNPKSKTRRNKK